MYRFFLICFLLLSACATVKTVQAPEGNFVECAYLGINGKDQNGSMVVNKLPVDFPAQRAGIKVGDIIVSLDGKLIKNNKELWDFMANKQTGEKVSLVINRQGDMITFYIEPRIMKCRPSSMKIKSLLLDNKKISLAVIVGEVKNSFSNVPYGWESSIRNEILSFHEGQLLSAYGTSENFSIVDRSRLKEILDEFRFSQLGLVSDKLMAKIGEMTGATHILDISFSRYPGRLKGYDDVTSARLIEIESGKVLAVDQFTNHY